MPPLPRKNCATNLIKAVLTQEIPTSHVNVFVNLRRIMVAALYSICHQCSRVFNFFYCFGSGNCYAHVIAKFTSLIYTYPYIYTDGCFSGNGVIVNVYVTASYGTNTAKGRSSEYMENKDCINRTIWDYVCGDGSTGTKIKHYSRLEIANKW